MSRHLPKNLDPLKLSVSMYVLTRVAKGLAGVPAHPKNPDQINMESIARAVGVAPWVVNEIRTHVEALAKTYGLEDPVAAARLQAIAAIAETYAGRPLPGRKSGPHLRSIAAEAKVTMWIVESAACRAAIAALAKTNGLTPFVKTVEAETAAINAYRERLVASGALLPWNYGIDRIDTPAVAAATGIAQFRLKAPTLAPAIERLIAEVGHGSGATFNEEVAGLNALVDRAIADRRPLPRGPRGIAFLQISREVGGVPVHRLRLMPAMRASIARWEAASRSFTTTTAPERAAAE
jgi:hypothetical protein